MSFLFRGAFTDNSHLVNSPTHVKSTPYGKFCLAKSDGVCETIARGEIWEPFLDPVYERYLPKDGVFVDVGANYGSQCIRLAGKCKKIYAFEPQKFIYDCLIETIRLNEITNIEAFNVGLGDRATRLETFQGPQSHLAYGTFQASSSWLREDSNGSIECKTLDSFNLGKIDLIKTDCQGYDYKVLVGATNTIKRDRPVIVFEVEPHPLDGSSTVGDFRNFLSQFGYSITEIAENNYLAI
jgi:FkbM family methyltransferase